MIFAQAQVVKEEVEVEIIAADFEMDAPADHSGFLTKQGVRHRVWRRRWFALRGTKLSYYSGPPPRGALKPAQLILRSETPPAPAARSVPA